MIVFRFGTETLHGRVTFLKKSPKIERPNVTYHETKKIGDKQNWFVFENTVYGTIERASQV